MDFTILKVLVPDPITEHYCLANRQTWSTGPDKANTKKISHNIVGGSREIKAKTSTIANKVINGTFPLKSTSLKL